MLGEIKEKWHSRLSEDKIAEFQTKLSKRNGIISKKIMHNGHHLLVKEYL